jgi:cysteine desulfuration protein SufE
MVDGNLGFGKHHSSLPDFPLATSTPGDHVLPVFPLRYEPVSILEQQQKVVDELNAIDDWKERYRAIILKGRSMPTYPDEHREDRFKVKGCQSQVWLYPELVDGRMKLQGDSDAEIVRGLVAIVLAVFDGTTPAEAATAPIDFVDRLGLSSNLSATRSNGLMAMIKQIRLTALAYQAMAARGIPSA